MSLPVSYQGQKKTCGGCGSTIHLAKACPVIEERNEAKKSKSGAKSIGEKRLETTKQLKLGKLGTHRDRTKTRGEDS